VNGEVDVFLRLGDGGTVLAQHATPYRDERLEVSLRLPDVCTMLGTSPVSGEKSRTVNGRSHGCTGWRRRRWGRRLQLGLPPFLLRIHLKGG
jgi:hypothetical protein